MSSRLFSCANLSSPGNLENISGLFAAQINTFEGIPLMPNSKA